MNTQKLIWTLVLTGAVITAACGDSNSSMNPAAPSAVVIGAQSETASGAVSSTTGKPANPGNGKQPTAPSAPPPPTNTSPTAPGLKKVEIEGLISAKSGDSITVNGQTVFVPSTCPIRHGSTTFTFSDLQVGDRVHVRASRTTTGTGATATTTLEATEVKLQNPGDGDDDTPPTL